MRRIALVNQKGGCGKTTTAINLAAGLAAKDRKVLLIDMDPQGHSGLGLGAEADGMEASIYEVLSGKIPMVQAIRRLRENLDIVLSDVVLSAFEQVMSSAPEREYRLFQSLDGIGNQYSYLIIDCPPSVGLLTFNSLMAADEVIVPVDPSHFSLHGLEKLLETIHVVEKRTDHELLVKILITCVDTRTNFCNNTVRTLRARFPKKCFDTVIHACTRIREAAGEGKSIWEFDRRCKASYDYHALTREVLAQEMKVEEPPCVHRLVQEARAEKGIIFTVNAPAEAQVQIAGDFNAWEPEPLFFEKDLGKSAWQKLISLKPGSYQYKYVINGQWVTDPYNRNTVRNHFGDLNSVVNV